MREILAGKADEVEALLKEWVAWMEKGEPETTIHEVYFSASRDQVAWLSTAKDMEALWFHSSRASKVDYMQRLAELTTNPKNMMFGAIDQEYRNVLSDVGVEVESWDLISGFDRKSG